jgi:EAL domain-containing protein (putative c-di-GMP-specific phosphodiesterase class I)
LGMSVVAEGIETPAQALRLQEMGCHIGQGWLYGKPVDADAFVSQWQQAICDATNGP